jgi:hypothetical protein
MPFSKVTGRYYQSDSEEFPSSISLVCTGCGAKANASCNCGKPYEPKSVRAREAIEAGPEKSNRAIAAETGISEPTIRRAREAAASDDAPDTVTGRDGKSYPAKKSKAMPEADVEPVPIGPTQLDYNGLLKEYNKLQRRHEKLLGKKPLSKGDDEDHVTVNDFVNLSKRTRELEARNTALSAAFNAKEGQASRNWPADMKPQQIKYRDKYLGNIAYWQRELEQLYGEVTGRPSWRVEVTTEDGRHLGTGARFGTRGEAEFYNANFATSQLGGDYATGEIIACEEKANVLIDGDVIRFKHGDCVLLNWHETAQAEDDPRAA